MEREHKDQFQKILSRIAAKIPGVSKIDTKRTDDGRLLLLFNDRGFQDPFFAQQMSDGTLKMFAFMLLLEDPDPAPFITGLLRIDKLIPKILGSGSEHSWRLHPYKGIGRIPKNLANKTDPAKRALLNQLPRILAGYGKSLAGQDAAVVVVIDLDDRNCLEFKQELLHVTKQCNPVPTVLFRLAIEEMEA